MSSKFSYEEFETLLLNSNQRVLIQAKKDEIFDGKAFPTLPSRAEADSEYSNILEREIEAQND